MYSKQPFRLSKWRGAGGWGHLSTRKPNVQKLDKIWEKKLKQNSYARINYTSKQTRWSGTCYAAGKSNKLPTEVSPKSRCFQIQVKNDAFDEDLSAILDYFAFKCLFDVLFVNVFHYCHGTLFLIVPCKILEFFLPLNILSCLLVKMLLDVVLLVDIWLKCAIKIKRPCLK